MKRKILSLLLVTLMILSTLTFISCDKGGDAEEGTTTRVTVDVNPSVEFMVDEENKVISVTALNDDGSILIAGEAFIGKTPEEAVELMVSLCVETGYLVKGNVEADANNVKISVSGDTKYAENLYKSVEKKAADTLEKLDIEGAVKKVEALNIEALRALALSTSLYTEEEINAMSEEQLYDVIAAGRIETALLLTEEMRNAYYNAKEYEISFAESEAVADIIESLGGLYTLTHTAYKTALEIYGRAITELDNLRYELLVSPDSAYQKSLVALRDAKADLIKQRTYTASLDVNGEEYTSASVTLQLSEENYDKALAAFEEMGRQANEALESLIATLREAETKLHELEETIFDDNIKETLQQKATDIEASVNAAKDSFFADFEAAHGEDIAAIESSLIAEKEALKASIEEGK